MRVVVTGAASGIGRATCLRLARDGRAAGRPAHVAAIDVETAKKKLTAAVAQFNVFELVLVIDTTGSMDPVFEPTKEAIIQLVRDLKTRAADVKGNTMTTSPAS